MTIELKKIKAGNFLVVDTMFRHDGRQFSKGAILEVKEVCEDYIKIDEPKEGSWNLNEDCLCYLSTTKKTTKLIKELMAGFIALDDSKRSIAQMRATKQEARDDVTAYMEDRRRDPFVAEIRIIEQIKPSIKITKIRK